MQILLLHLVLLADKVAIMPRFNIDAFTDDFAVVLLKLGFHLFIQIFRRDSQAISRLRLNMAFDFCVGFFFCKGFIELIHWLANPFNAFQSGQFAGDLV